METTPTATPAPLAKTRRIDWSVVSTWLLGFGLIALLGFNGGGYDPQVHDQVGIAVWWIVLVGALVGALPLRRLGTPAWVALGLFAAFGAWTALSLTWTESTERTAADLARVAGYVGVFALALLTRGSRTAHHLIAAIATAIATVALVGLLSRLHPAWFPEARETAQFLTSSSPRLGYPLHYWNALASLIAVGLPLLLHIATSARLVAIRAIAGGALPAIALTVFFTLSRGGTAAAIIGVAVFLTLASDRLPKLLTTLVAAGGGGILIAAATQRDALEDGLLNATAHSQGDEMLAMTLVVCAGVGFIQAGISLVLMHSLRPRWTVPSRAVALASTAVAAIAVAIAFLALDGPGHTSSAWDNFKSSGGPSRTSERLGSASSNGRYELWASAVRQSESKPLIGTGAATFEYWWARDSLEGDSVGFVRDAHNLYLQTLGELGIVGLTLLSVFLLFVLIEGMRRLILASAARQSLLAASLAGCVGLLFAAGFDWYWQIPVLPVALLLLASVLVTSGDGEGQPRRFSLPLRAGFVLFSLAAIVAIAIPLASATLIRQSQAEARSGQAATALKSARAAQKVQPGAASPLLQQALILEQQGDHRAAAAQARAATAREPTNWRTWLTLSRIEAARGDATAAIRNYRTARSLNPNSGLFR